VGGAGRGGQGADAHLQPVGAIGPLLAAEALVEAVAEHVDIAGGEAGLEEEAARGAPRDLLDLLGLLHVLGEVRVVEVVPAGEARHAGGLLARQAVEQDVGLRQRLVELRAGPLQGQVEGVDLARLERSLPDPGGGGTGPLAVGVAEEEVHLEVSELPQQEAHGAAHAAGPGDHDLVFLAHIRTRSCPGAPLETPDDSISRSGSEAVDARPGGWAAS
jgi:hypothetical protein